MSGENVFLKSVLVRDENGIFVNKIGDSLKISFSIIIEKQVRIEIGLYLLGIRIEIVQYVLKSIKVSAFMYGNNFSNFTVVGKNAIFECVSK